MGYGLCAGSVDLLTRGEWTRGGDAGARRTNSGERIGRGRGEGVQDIVMIKPTRLCDRGT